MNKVPHAPDHGIGSAFPSRRSFIIAVVGTGVMLGFARSGLTAPVPSAEDQAGVTPAGLFEPTIWYSIDRDGLVPVNITRAEMGQDVGTALARIVADELEADRAGVRIVYVTSPRGS
jgi:isoquinoline 1-oxidoreductase subunit beta